MLNLTELDETTNERTPKKAACKTSLHNHIYNLGPQNTTFDKQGIVVDPTPCNIHFTPTGVSQTWYMESAGGEESTLRKCPDKECREPPFRCS